MVTKEVKKRLIQVAKGDEKADLVIKNVSYLNVFTNKFIKADVAIADGYIAGIGEYNGKIEINGVDKTLVPGFIDGHIHLESSLVSPLNFSKVVSKHGTTAVITDPHEITNVLGTDGIDYMLMVTENLPIDVYFAVPSCVPASPFDENGARITHIDTEKYMSNPRVLGLAEMMNFPATLMGDEEILEMILSSQSVGKTVDGHAPGLSGNRLNAYVASGVNSDHECTNFDEALEKLSLGQYIMIRQGTAGRNFDALAQLLKGDTYNRCMFATDDKHPVDLLINGDIDYIIKKAISAGVRPEIAYKVASFNAAQYFGLKSYGAVAPGYKADLVILNDVKEVSIHSVFKNGVKVDTDNYNANMDIDPLLEQKVRNTMHTDKITEQSLCIKKEKEKVIGLIGGEIITTDEGEASEINIEKDILKVCVVERHKNTGHIGVCFVKGYGLKSGAVATSVAHDSHNIIAIGTNDSDLVTAVNAIIDMNGGMVVCDNSCVLESQQLEIAGIMTDDTVNDVFQKMIKLKDKAYELGVNENIDPFMTLSFVSLPVIPSLKLTSMGVVDVNKFELLK